MLCCHIPARCPAALREMVLPGPPWAQGPGQAHEEALPPAFSTTSICLLPRSRLSKGRIRRLCYGCWEGWHSPLAELTSLWHGHSVATSPCDTSSGCGACGRPCAAVGPGSPAATPLGLRALRGSQKPRPVPLHAPRRPCCCPVSRAPPSSDPLPRGAQNGDCVLKKQCAFCSEECKHRATARVFLLSSLALPILLLSPLCYSVSCHFLFPIGLDDCTRHGLK